MAMVHGEQWDNQNEKKFIRKDGSLIWCMTSANLIYDEQDVAVRISLVIRDITRKDGMCTFLGSALKQMRLKDFPNLCPSASKGSV